jgi:hypothetical protein
MKTKLEDFKDRSELFRWASEGKPISYSGDVYITNPLGRAYFNMIKGHLVFYENILLYKKVIETETINESMKLAAMLNSDNEILFYPCVVNNTKLIAKLKITATIEKCKKTGEIASKEFKLEEVE